MKKVSTWIVFLLTLLVLCLPVSSLAAGELTPVRTTLYGAIVGNTTSSTYSLPVYQVDSDTFCIIPSRNYNAVSQFNFFFSIPSGFTSFKIVYSFDESYFSNITDGTFSMTLVSYNYSNGALTDTFNLSGATSTQSTSNGRVTITHQWRGSEKDRNCVSVGFLTNITVANQNQYYNFDVDEFIVNGVAVEDLAVTEQNAEWEDTITQLAQNEERMWAQVIAPDLTDTLDRISQGNNDTYQDYKMVISSVSINNFLIPGLLFIVFSFAFYSYVVFGRKG